jgi:hypothetical protein
VISILNCVQSLRLGSSVRKLPTTGSRSRLFTAEQLRSTLKFHAGELIALYIDRGMGVAQLYIDYLMLIVKAYLLTRLYKYMFIGLIVQDEYMCSAPLILSRIPGLGI